MTGPGPVSAEKTDPVEINRRMLAEAKPVLAALADVDRERRGRIGELIELGFRSRNLVGEYGELLTRSRWARPWPFRLLLWRGADRLASTGHESAKNGAARAIPPQ